MALVCLCSVSIIYEVEFQKQKKKKKNLKGAQLFQTKDMIKNRMDTLSFPVRKIFARYPYAEEAKKTSSLSNFQIQKSTPTEKG